MACRFNRRRVWTGRLLLEQLAHGDSVFATLTIADVPRGHHGPPQRKVWEVDVSYLQDFMRALRLKIAHPIRFYGVGEYGDKSWRAHYHVALFGVSPLHAQVIQDCWPHGGVHIGDLTRDSAQYIAGYVCKKMTKGDDPRLGGRNPEFARMSLRPGIGAVMVPGLTSSLAPEGDVSMVRAMEDVPAVMRSGGKDFPIGRYVRRKLRKALGWEEGITREATVRMQVEYLGEDPIARDNRREVGIQRAEARAKIYKQRKL